MWRPSPSITTISTGTQTVTLTPQAGIEGRQGSSETPSEAMPLMASFGWFYRKTKEDVTPEAYTVMRKYTITVGLGVNNR